MTFVNCLYNLFLMPLQLLFEVVFRYAYRLLEHPGLAIIALSLAINLLVLPLYRRADAMQEEERETESKLNPAVTHIKKTFKGDERTMMLQTYYRQNHYSPLSVLRSAVSLFLQIPFFIAAYRFLSNLELLNGVAFGPIADLSMPDNLLVIGGLTINLLPIIMTLINVLSTVIFTKNDPLKTKIQLYVLAAFFLVFLYNSPSGLVFYWTLNNVFSLIKTIFYQLKEPKKVLSVLTVVLGIVGIGCGLWLFIQGLIKKAVVVTGISLILCIPFVYQNIKKHFVHPMAEIKVKTDKRLFFTGAVFIALLIGLLIPSALIGDSPQEFLTLNMTIHPLWYMVSALLIALGTFVFWGGVFYALATPKTKMIFENVVWIACGITIIDYLFFGRDFGIISVDLVFEKDLLITFQEKSINLIVILAAAVVMIVIIKKWQPAVKRILLVGVLALICMSGINIVGICQSIDQVNTASSGSSNSIIQLNKNGKNVIVFMLDRALGEYVPYIFNEKPELKEQFSGFTYYSNVVSFGRKTNTASPALFGGYEYTPLEINARSSELLVEKQNEALKVMPVIFNQAGYDVTVCDPPYAGYQWVPDLSIYKDYPGIKTYNTIGMLEDGNDHSASCFRNFFCYGIMKVAPSFLQGTFYDNGTYNGFIKEASDFMRSYSVMSVLSDLTSIDDKATNTFLMIDNEMTHSPTLLQEPDYEPSSHVDNTKYDASHQDRFTVNGRTIHIENELQLSHYQVNMAAFIQLGKWFDYLRSEGVYDNTRIIVVSDHGHDLYQMEELVGDDDFGSFFPVLMVKDFNSTGFNTSDLFMTNADVPTLALQDLINDPVNPFTGKMISNSEKNAHPQAIFTTLEFDIGTNNGSTFFPDDWYSVHDSIWEKGNWTKIGENTVLPKNNIENEGK